VNVFPSLGQHTNSMMAIQNSSIRPNFQRALLTGSKRGFQIIGCEAPKRFEFDSIQRVLGMQKFEVRLLRLIHGLLLVILFSLRYESVPAKVAQDPL
jgi:hypothetical protein